MKLVFKIWKNIGLDQNVFKLLKHGILIGKEIIKYYLLFCQLVYSYKQYSCVTLIQNVSYDLVNKQKQCKKSSSTDVTNCQWILDNLRFSPCHMIGERPWWSSSQQTVFITY